MINRISLQIIQFLFCIFAITPVHATSVLPLQLDQIVGDAQLVFQGICTANVSEHDGTTGLIVTYTTFAVQDVLKGSVGSSHTIKQVGGHVGASSYRILGVPSFTIGQEYVVFLYGVSNAGFSSPVGLGQGQFVVSTGPNGRELSNGRDFKEMIPSGPDSAIVKSARAQNGGGSVADAVKYLGLDDFKQIVRQRLGSQK